MARTLPWGRRRTYILAALTALIALALAPASGAGGRNWPAPEGNPADAPAPSALKQSTEAPSQTRPAAPTGTSGSSQPVTPVPPAARTTSGPAEGFSRRASGFRSARGKRRRDGRAGRRNRGGDRGRSGSGADFVITSPSPDAAALVPAPAAPISAPSPASSRDRAKREPRAPRRDEPSTVVRTFNRVVEVVPGFVKAIVAVLAFLLVIACLAWFLLARTARYLRHQRETLLGEIGTLQGALLPTVPAELSSLHASVAYRPAEGLAAGGDFYDAFPLEDGRVGIVVGDVAGHGKEALMHTALLRYTMRAYLEADMEPRTAIQVAGRVLDRGFDTLATVVLAVYDPGRHLLRYATAGHPPPVFLGDADHDPVTQASSPPIGAGMPTGLRQTTVSLPAGSAVCFFTDGLIEARRDGALIGRLGLVELIRELGPHATAEQLLERVAVEADLVSDDMAACMFRVAGGPVRARSARVEQIEVRDDEPLEAVLRRFLPACGVTDEASIERTVAAAQRAARQFGGAVASVTLSDERPQIDVKPANVETLAWAYARRAAS
jgi:hypothetical protein